MHVTAIYPGTFDPLTMGHYDVICRAARMFDQLIVAIAKNPGKNPFFTLDERMDMAGRIVASLPNVSVAPFEGLLVNFAAEQEARVIVRGLRAISDFDYEVQIAGMNRLLSPELETVFIAASHEHTYLSSSIVREIAHHRGDIGDFVDPLVVAEFARKMQ